MLGKKRTWNMPLRTAMLAGMALAAPLALNADFGTPFNLSTLNGTNGFSVISPFSGDRLNVTESTPVGDFNGDGIDDVLLQFGPRSFFNGSYTEFEHGAYVLYGSTSAPVNPVSVCEINGANGFIVSIQDSTIVPFSVASADFNGDGFDDIILGDPGYGSGAGQVQVVFGNNGTNFTNNPGLNIGHSPAIGFGINFGASVSGAGDFNGDGVEDIVVGAPLAGTSSQGAAYVIFGNTTAASLGSVAFDNELNHVALNNFALGAFAGDKVSAAGDFNDDGFDDVLVSQFGRSGSLPLTPGMNVYFGTTGSTVPVAPTSSFGADKKLNFQLANLQPSFIVSGVITDFAPAGDFNNDGTEDIIVGSSSASAAVVLFGNGSTTYQTYYALGDTNASFRLPDLSLFGYDGGFGSSVAGLGDFNGDNFDDIIIGSPTAIEPFFSGGSNFQSGNGFVVFGYEATYGSASSIPSQLNGSNGFEIKNTTINSIGAQIGARVAGGDFNDDGVADVLISAPAQSSGRGVAYIIYGEKGSIPTGDLTGPELTLDRLVTNQLPFTLAGSYSDPSGVDRVRGRISDNGNPVLGAVTDQYSAPLPTGGSFSLPFTPVSLADGVYDVDLDSEDGIGNLTTIVEEDKFVYDTTPPVFEVVTSGIFGVTEAGLFDGGQNDLFPCVGYNGSRDISLLFEDITYVDIADESAILAASSIGLTINGSNFSVEGSDSRLFLDLTFGDEGTYDLVFPVGSLQDEAGNGNTEEVSFCLEFDATAPQLECEAAFAPVGGSQHFNNEPVYFTLTFSEPVFGITPNNFEVITNNGYVNIVRPLILPSKTFTIEVYPYGVDSFGEKSFVSGEYLELGFYVNNSGSGLFNGAVFDIAGNRYTQPDPIYTSITMADPFEDLPEPALVISEGIKLNDRFGTSVALDGRVAVVGAERDGLGGQAFVYDSHGTFFKALPVDDSTTTFTQQALLEASDSRLNDLFGASVAVSGDVIAVGAPYHDDPANPITRANSGAVYIFSNNTKPNESAPAALENKGVNPIFNNWVQTQKIQAPATTQNSRFGSQVVIAGNLMAISEPYERFGGAVYIYLLDPCTGLWSFEQRIQAADVARNDDFGFSIALEGNRLLVGSPRDDDRGTDTGSAYYYIRINSVWFPLDKFVPGDAVRLDRVGTSVDSTTEFLAIGAPGFDYAADPQQETPAIRDAGRIYTFINENFFNNNNEAPVTEDGSAFFSGWLTLAAIDTNNVAKNSDGIGTTVAISGLNVVAGAPFSDFAGNDAGAAYLYRFFENFDGVSENGGGQIFGAYELVDVLTLPTPLRNDYFSNDLDISRNYVLIGAPGASHPKKDIAPAKSGLAAFYDLDGFFR